MNKSKSIQDKKMKQHPSEQWQKGFKVGFEHGVEQSKFESAVKKAVKESNRLQKEFVEQSKEEQCEWGGKGLCGINKALGGHDCQLKFEDTEECGKHIYYDNNGSEQCPKCGRYSQPTTEDTTGYCYCKDGENCEHRDHNDCIETEDTGECNCIDSFDSATGEDCPHSSEVKTQQGWEKQQIDISLELTEMLFNMMTSKKKKESYYINKISEKIQKIISQEIESARASERKKLLKEIDPFDLVVDCKPDCTPVEHAYHQGTWDSYLKLEKLLEKVINR